MEPDVRELARRTAAAPDDHAAWLALAQAQAKAKAIDDATVSYWRARATGADVSVCRDGLKALNADTSAWSSADCNSRCTRSALTVGPRASAVLARHRHMGPKTVPVITEDGTLIFCAGGNETLLDGRTLEVKQTRKAPTPECRGPVFGPRGLLLYIEKGGLHASTGNWSTLLIERPDCVNVVSDHRGRIVLTAEGGRRIVVLSDELTVSAEFEVPTPATRMILRGFEIVVGTDSGLFAYDFAGSPRHQFPGLAKGPNDKLKLTGYLGDGHFRDLAYYEEGNDHWSVVHDRLQGKLGWTVRLGAGELASYAESPDGTGVYVLWNDGDARSRLLKIDKNGLVAWTVNTRKRSPGSIVLDKEGVVYLAGEKGLLGLAPSGRPVLELNEPGVPVTLDAWGRLLLIRDDWELSLVGEPEKKAQA
jgi:hypothetical protein